ncbi:hypothetical protein M1D82_11370 [Pseudomonas sp. D4-18]|uniref:hypothetical protein n=1 Tax=Pseudomonas sp. R1-18 TaxID=1632772 RepID=UPI003DA7DCDD
MTFPVQPLIWQDFAAALLRPTLCGGRALIGVDPLLAFLTTSSGRAVMKFGFSLGTALKLAPVTLLAFVSQDLHGACSLASTPGNDINVCDSGSAAALLDTAGNNSLTFPAGGTGSISGNVVFGDGQDRIDMGSGLIGGNVSQAAGEDTFALSGGTITGDISQGPGTDTFSMSAGSVRSLLQGDGLDRFTMIGGTISNAFEDGDSATMSGGTIGRVDMKLDDNLFDLSGGRILGNLVTGFGRDTIIISGGSIGGAVSVSGGDDQVTVSGGEIIGEVRTSFGNDRLAWRGDGYLRNNVLLADGDDSATLESLDEAHLRHAPSGCRAGQRLTDLQQHNERGRGSVRRRALSSVGSGQPDRQLPHRTGRPFHPGRQRHRHRYPAARCPQPTDVHGRKHRAVSSGPACHGYQLRHTGHDHRKRRGHRQPTHQRKLSR